MSKGQLRQHSIKHKVIFLVMGQLLLTLVAVIVLVLFLVNQLISEQAEAQFISKANNLNQKLEQRITYLFDSAERFSTNSLILSALINEIERDDYLPPLFDNFLRDEDVVSLSLVDRNGLPIYATQQESLRFHDSHHITMALALSQPVSLIDVKSKHFVVLSPIENVAGTHGLAVFAFDLRRIAARQISQEYEGYVRLLKAGQSIFSQNHSEEISYRSYIHTPQSDTPMLRRLGIQLEIGLPQDEYNAPIRSAILALVVLGVVCILVGIVTSSWTAARITQPIMKLYKRVREADTDQDMRCYPLGSGDELDDLAKAFDERTVRLRHQAQHDSLTGLPNRVLFLDRLEQAINMASRNQDKLAVLFVDLDRFKEVNDSFGHVVGDELLIAVAETLQSSVRSFDTVARLAGDEFCLLLNRIEGEEAIISVLQKTMSLFQEPLKVGGQCLTMTCSIGVAIYPENGLQPDELLKHADAAMYRAKDEGRNTYEFYTHDLTEHAQERLLLENNLRNAVAQQELELYYQPQVCVDSGCLLGMEALVRWHHPERGLMLPNEFIPLAEETGLIIDIDRWVMQQAMRQLSIWKSEGFDPGLLSINISMSHLVHDDFLNSFKRLLKQQHLSATDIMLEVTETQAMLKPEKTIVVLKQLKTLGVRLAIDDFGTGFSSLSYLKRFPVDRIKIDKSFIAGLPEDHEDVGLTQAIIALSRSLKKEVIAEGVETPAQSQFLANLGCIEAQGFLYYPPLSSAEIRRLLPKPTMQA